MPDRQPTPDALSAPDLSKATPPTPRPWRHAVFMGIGPTGEKVFHCGLGIRGPAFSEEQEANAALIVEAVNSYDRLRAELVDARGERDAYMASLAYACAERDELVAALEAILDEGMLGAHTAHWDREGNSGRTCPACIANNKVAVRARAVLAKVKP